MMWDVLEAVDSLEAPTASVAESNRSKAPFRSAEGGFWVNLAKL
jgi:hypothetical protein